MTIPATLRQKPRGTAARHARERLRERYGFALTKRQWRDMADSIAAAIARGEAFEEQPDVARDDARASRWRGDVAIQLEGRNVVVPVGFSYDGERVVILTILPGGRCSMPR